MTESYSIDPRGCGLLIVESGYGVTRTLRGDLVKHFSGDGSHDFCRVRIVYSSDDVVHLEDLNEKQFDAITSFLTECMAKASSISR